MRHWPLAINGHIICKHRFSGFTLSWYQIDKVSIKLTTSIYILKQKNVLVIPLARRIIYIIYHGLNAMNQVFKISFKLLC